MHWAYVCISAHSGSSSWRCLHVQTLNASIKHQNETIQSLSQFEVTWKALHSVFLYSFLLLSTFSAHSPQDDLFSAGKEENVWQELFQFFNFISIRIDWTMNPALSYIFNTQVFSIVSLSVLQYIPCYQLISQVTGIKIVKLFMTIRSTVRVTNSWFWVISIGISTWSISNLSDIFLQSCISSLPDLVQLICKYFLHCC